MKPIGANSWIECNFTHKKASIGKQILSALDIVLPRYGNIFILIRVGNDGEITKAEKKKIGIPVQTGVKGVRKGCIQLILPTNITKRKDIK